MRPIHKKLHLQHHRHTGRLLHHKHTSYRGLAVVLGLSTAFVVGFTSLARATADSLYVYARIPAPIPITAPVITDPSSNRATSKATLVVSGTCPIITPKVIIVILDNGSEAGSAACDANNNFQVSITLQPGANVLVARSFTITGDSGPDSTSVTVTYNPPVPPPALGSSGNNVSPLDLTIDESFMVFGREKDALWLGSIIGGTGPYQLRIDWGDGAQNTYTFATAGQHTTTHHYPVLKPYDTIFYLSDHSGQHLIRHYAAVPGYVPPTVNTPLTTLNGRGKTNLFGLYGIYLLVLAAFGWLWARSHPYVYAKVPVYHRYYSSRRGRPTKRNS